MIVSHRVALDAPARTVAAVLAEPWLLREHLGVAAPDTGQLWAGQRVMLGRRPLRVDLADERGVVLAGRSAGLAALVGDGQVAYTLRLPGRGTGDALAELAEAVRQRAVRLGAAPVVVGAAIMDGRRVLTQQRDRPVADAGYWEFPGGRVEPGESEPDAVVRECVEELGVRVRVTGRIGPDLVLANGWVLRVYAAGLVSGRPRAVEHRAVRWIGPGELAGLDWLPADRVLVPRLRALLTERSG
jgi:8-oxo-dGTP pyrophosphatase MutT (NUDIX family)